MKSNKISIIIHVLAAIVVFLCIYVLGKNTRCSQGGNTECFYFETDEKKDESVSPSQPNTTNELKISAEEICQEEVSLKCDPLRETWEKATPANATSAFNIWKLCAKNTYNECACKHKPEILQICYDGLKQSEPGQDRVTGCYTPGMNPDERKSCFEDPVKFLCQDPESENCKDVQAQCPDPCAKEEDLFAPVPDIA